MTTPVRSQVDPILQLRKKLNAAIEKEEYELAAQLRDEIREIQKKSGSSTPKSGQSKSDQSESEDV